MPRVSEARAESRRLQILHAASVCIAKNGFHRTTMKQICAEARLSPGAVYTWFPSKHAIIKEMTARRLASFAEAMAATGSDPQAGVRLYLATIAQAAATPTVGRLNIYLVAEASRDRFARDTMRAVAREGVAILKNAFRRLLPHARAEADGRARLLQAAGFGIVVQSLIDPKGEIASFELAESLIAPRDGTARNRRVQA